MKNFNIGCLIKVIALIGVAAFIAFIYLTCSGGSGCLCQKIDKSLPDVNRAPFIVTTKTHTYYAQTAQTGADGSVTMGGWFERLGDNWVYQEKPLTLPEVLKPAVKRR